MNDLSWLFGPRPGPSRDEPAPDPGSAAMRSADKSKPEPAAKTAALRLSAAFAPLPRIRSSSSSMLCIPMLSLVTLFETIISILAELSDSGLASTVHSRRPGPNSDRNPPSKRPKQRVAENGGSSPAYIDGFGECRHRAAKSFRAREHTRRYRRTRLRPDRGGENEWKSQYAQRERTKRDMDIEGTRRLEGSETFGKLHGKAHGIFMWRRGQKMATTRPMILLESIGPQSGEPRKADRSSQATKNSFSPREYSAGARQVRSIAEEAAAA